MDELKYIKNNVRKKNKTICGLLILIFGVFGFHRIYMGKKDFLWAPILMLITGGVFYYVLLVNGLIILTISDKRFQMLCQVKNRKLERKILRAKEEELDKLINEWGMILPDEELDSSMDNDTVGKNYVNKNSMDSIEHEHIKEDPTLSKQYNKAQDRLERYQNNDYFPSANKNISVKNKSEKLKELKEELKAGLISKEDYNEELSNLFK